MKQKRSTLIVLSMLTLTAVLLSSCAPAATPVVSEPPATPEATEAPVVESPSATIAITGLVDNPLQLPMLTFRLWKSSRSASNIRRMV